MITARSQSRPSTPRRRVPRHVSPFRAVRSGTAAVLLPVWVLIGPLLCCCVGGWAVASGSGGALSGGAHVASTTCCSVTPMVPDEGVSSASCPIRHGSPGRSADDDTAGCLSCDADVPVAVEPLPTLLPVHPEALAGPAWTAFAESYAVSHLAIASRAPPCAAVTLLALSCQWTC